MVNIHLRRVVGLILLLVMIAACTRDRPQPEPVITSVSLDTPVSDAGEGQEPEVATATPVPAEADTPTPVTASEGSESTATPTLAPDDAGGQLIPYTVEQGDTMSSIAAKFGTTVEAIRQINFLTNDNILTGQLLRIPLGEGYLPEGGQPTPTPQPYIYVVQAGDTLNGIALKFGAEVAAIIDANRLLDPNNVFVGQQIVIPGYQTAVSTSVEASGGTNRVEHVVQPGETLLSIAQQYGVSAADIAAANNIQNRNLLRVGQQIFIPGVTALDVARTNQRVHIVQPGEGLLAIAVRYGVTTEELAALNNIQDVDIIVPGQELIIPGN